MQVVDYKKITGTGIYESTFSDINFVHFSININ